jgi:hypothetical protein
VKLIVLPTVGRFSVAQHLNEYVGPDRCCARWVWAVLDDLDAVGRPAGAGEPVMAGHQVVDVAGDADLGGGQHDQVVAHPLQVGHQV